MQKLCLVMLRTTFFILLCGPYKQPLSSGTAFLLRCVFSFISDKMVRCSFTFAIILQFGFSRFGHCGDLKNINNST